MEALFESLSRAIEGAPAVALLAVLVWGVLSIVLSPCHLASIPLIVGFIAGEADNRARRAFWIASSFSLGILGTIAAIGAFTSAAGRMMGDLDGWVNYAVALVFFVVGLHLVGVIELPLPGAKGVGVKRKGYGAAFALGATFGIALGPCTFAFMAPVLATTLKVGTHAPLFATLLLLAYGVGHCAVIVVAGTSAQITQRALNWTNQSKATTLVKGACGILVMAGGLYLIYSVH